jgi:hypothetical protein
MQSADAEGPPSRGAPPGEAQARERGVTAPEDPPAPASTRFRLARLASETALKTRDVARLVATRSANVTHERGQVVEGVVVAAQPGGGYTVRLHVAARLVPLHELAGQIRSRLVRSAERQGIRAELGEIDIVIEDIAEATADVHEAGAAAPSAVRGEKR